MVLVISTHIALHSFKFIAMIPHFSWGDCAYLRFVGCVEVIGTGSFKIAIQGDCTRPGVREAVASNPFTLESMMSPSPWGGGSYLVSVGSVEVVVGPVPVAIERHSPWHS